MNQTIEKPILEEKEVKMKIRLDYPDIFKGIAILLMVIGHCYGSCFLSKYAYSFHMAAFFFISGYLTDFKKGSASGFIVKRIFLLMIPFFIYGTIFLSIKAILLSIPNYISPFGYTDYSYLTSLKLMFGLGEIYSQPLGATWFIPTIFFGSIIIKFLSFATGGKRWLVFLFSSGLCILGFYLISNGIRAQIWLISPRHVLIAQYLICLGWLVKESLICQKYISKDHPIIVMVVGLISLAISLIFYFIFHTGVDIANIHYPKPTYAFVVASLSGSMMLLCLSIILSLLPKPVTWVFKYMGKASFAILIFHFLGIKLFGLLLVALNVFKYSDIFSVVPPGTTPVWLRAFYIIIAIIFSLGMYEILRRIPVVNCLTGFNSKWGEFLRKKIDQGIAFLNQ